MPLCGNRRHLRSLARTFAVYTQLTLKAAPQLPTIGRPPSRQKSNFVVGAFHMPPLLRNLTPTGDRKLLPESF